MKKKNIEEADASLAGLIKSKESAEFRVAYYSNQERVSSGEQKSLDALEESRIFQAIAELAEIKNSIHSLLPNVSITTAVTPSVSVSFGGSNVGAADQAIASGFRAASNAKAYESTRSGTMAGYDRRLKDWRFQADLAKKEIEQLDKQILAAEIRKQIAEADLENHDKQIANSEEVEDFLKLKFTSQELYSWMLSKLSSLYFQAYQMALQFAKQAEQTFKHELGPGEAGLTFVTSLYWDSLKKGLIAGEQLHHDLRRMEQAYLDANRRELEITKHVSLFQLDSMELLALRETGKCSIYIPEILFDLDFPGHYFRRIKAVRLTIPCVAGPYTNISATLTLQKERLIRRNTDLTDPLQPEPDSALIPQSAIATSSANQDSGLFELNFNDPRYLPFEGAGAISGWTLELPGVIRPFDYDTITDVVLHLSYTARDGSSDLQGDGTTFKQAVNNGLISSLNKWKTLIGQDATLSRLISLRQDFSTEWNRLLFPGEAQSQSITLNLNKRHFPKNLDYLWRESPEQPITLTVDSATIYLNPTPDNLVTAEGVAFTINDAPATVSDPPGLIQFNPLTGLSGTEITNTSGLEYAVNISGGQLLAEEWKDLYILISYRVDAGE